MGNTFYNEDKDNSKKLLFAIGVSMLFITFWNLIWSPNNEELQKQAEQQKIEKTKINSNKKEEDKTKNNINNHSEQNNTKQKQPKKEVFLNTNDIKLGIDVNNNIISFLVLKKHKQSANNPKNIVLLDDEHFIESGCIGCDNNIKWQLQNKTKNDVILYGSGKQFNYITHYNINEDNLIKITQTIKNKSKEQKKIALYSRSSFLDTSDRIENSYAFRGILIMNENKINEISFDDIKKTNINFANSNEQGWIGLSDQYWLTALINLNHNSIPTSYTARYNKEKNRYQIDFNDENAEYIKPNETITREIFAYTGEKNLDALQKISNKYKIEKFDKAIDFGIFYFLSKPLLIILKKLYKISENFGIAIILLTILVRMIIFPLAHRSYKSTAQIKAITPKIKELREKYKDDKKKLQSETFELYKRYKINPMSAIFPMLLQIPIFFALYKVLVISIEMRGAPFLGFIKDLSAKDPTSIFNLFGLLPFEVPELLHIGILPCIMGLTMFIQQKLTPNVSTDPMQQKIMNWFPVIFMFIFAGMPAGLVLYWSCSNVFTIIQQGIIIKFTKIK